MEQGRTIREFVEDEISDGRSLKEIIAIALCSRWKNQITEIEKMYKDWKGKKHGN